MTAKQISRRTAASFDTCRDVVRELTVYGLVRCLNPSARRSRLYWLTPMGAECQRRVCASDGRTVPEHFLPPIDWEMYGRVCYSHRGAIVKTLTEPMQPAAVKRRARQRLFKLQMSANNARDIFRLFRRWGIVEPVQIRKKAHLRYRLSDHGLIFQQLPHRAEALA